MTTANASATPPVVAENTANVEDGKVVLVDDADGTTRVKIATDGTAAGEFQLKITFDQDVFGAAANDGSTIAVDDLATTEVTNFLVLAGETGTTGADLGGISVPAVTREVTSAEGVTPIVYSKRSFIITLGVAGATIQTGGATENNLPMRIWIGLSADAVFSARNAVSNTDGEGNEAVEGTDRAMITVVQSITPTTANTPPVFDEDAPSADDLTWCEGEMKGAEAIRLPKARDSESASGSLEYELTGPNGRVPHFTGATAPTMGLYWVTRDSENRYIRGKAEVADAGEYTWKATDSGTPALSNEDPMTFTIKVDPAEDPGAPTGAMAMKLDSAATDSADPEYNRVKLTWADGNPTEYPNDDCIPGVIAYIVTRTPIRNGEADKSAAVMETLNIADDKNETHFDLSDKMALTYQTEDALARGTYQFTIQAVSSHPISKANMTSDASSAATWDKTGHSWVIVANPPVAPTDLRAVVNNDTDEVTVNWNAPEVNSAAPIDDTLTEDRMRVYGVDQGFGGYAVYQIKDGATVRYPTDATMLLTGASVVFKTDALTAGQYTFRVTASNIAGESRRSISTPYSTVTVVAVNDPPVFTVTSIDDINAMEGEALPRAITLPDAKDPEGQPVQYRVAPPLPAGLTFSDTTRTITGTPRAGSAGTTHHTYTAYDAAPNATGVQRATLSFTINVKAAPGTVTPEDPVATYNDATKTTTIHSGTIAANGFYLVDATALPNLELFFSTGGTITLMDTADTAAKTVVMSEILWGLDFGEPALSQSNKQFIELYNTNMSGSLNLAGWKLVFQEGRPTPANDVDQISNVDGAGWIVDVGQSGRVSGTTLVGGTVLPTDIISMYRNINYAKVQHTDGGDAAKRLDGVPGGNAKGSWAASTRVTTDAGVKSSPGRRHFKAVTVLTPTAVPSSPFIINEIGNGTGGANDWIEFRNVTAGEESLKNYQLSVVTGTNADDKKDTQLFHFHDKDYKVPAGGVIVVCSTHPRNTDLAQGKDVAVADDQEENNGASHLFVVRSFNLPDSGKNLLILRKSAKSHEKQHLGTPNDIIDVVGTLGIAIKTADFETKRWPLSLSGAPHGNVVEPGAEELAAGKVYTRANAGAGSGSGEKHIGVAGYTGLGYDRAATSNAVNGGTPGYDNGAIKGKLAELPSDTEVTFSEIMLDTGTGRLNLPQWIEVYNNSMTHSVNTNGWKLTIENAKDVDTALDAVITLGDMKIAPNQTILITTNDGRVSDPDHFPDNRVMVLWRNKAHRDALGMTKRTEQVFSQTGLYLKLTDADNKLVDEFGNLDGSRRTRDEPKWVIPMPDDDERRSSLTRIYEAGVALTGTTKEAWVSADMTNLAFAISQTYYGDPDDYSTPGFRGGGPLPVSLSKFRPERMKDTGEIIVRWVTESELNNAGFNILRSEKRDGEFTKVHFQAGKGTTSERTAYEWKDTSAKPNVVYYYQIQDVSLDGEVTTLRITHLRGNVTAVGKATTTWGEIKALQ